MKTIENSFESANAMQCKMCGELISCDQDSLEEHLEEHK